MKKRMEIEAQLNAKMKEIEQLRTELSQSKGNNNEEHVFDSFGYVIFIRRFRGGE